MYFQVDPYDIIGILLETLLYGAFLILLTLSTVLLLYRRKLVLRENAGSPTKANSLLFYLITSMMMFCTITAKWSFYWPEVFPIPERVEGTLPQIPRLSRTVYRFKEACIQSTVLLGDCIIIYRLWILTGKRKALVALPLCGVLAFVASAIALDGPFNDTTTSPIPVENEKIFLTRWDIAATAITLGITVYVTVMISWIILSTQSRIEGMRLGGSGMKKALAIVVESAAISATWNLLFFIAGLGFNSQVALCLLNCLPAVYGVSAMLINVRVGLGFALGAGGSAGIPTRSGFPGGGYVSTIIFSTQHPSNEESIEQGEAPKATTSIVMTVPR
ncbi:hypothetical protein Ac2012v2_007517 [Leucoagaricus gongylophorus]